MKFCRLNIIGLSLIIIGISLVIGQGSDTNKLENIIQHYRNLSEEYDKQILESILRNETVELPKCRIPKIREKLSYRAISPRDYNIEPQEGEFVEAFTILLTKCKQAEGIEHFDDNIDSVLVCYHNGTWSRSEYEICRSLISTHYSYGTNTCFHTSCGPKSQCKESDDSPLCSCWPGYVGEPPNCKPQCTADCHCSINEECVNSKCVKASCPECGVHAHCNHTNGLPDCQCNDGYLGNPFMGCYPKPKYDAFVLDNVTGQSIHPCYPYPCGANTYCDNGVCKCNPGYYGSPYYICRTECEIDTDCPENKICSDKYYKCIDPCPGACGTNATCQIYNHVVICNCPFGQIGDPYVGCRPQCDTSSECLFDLVCINNKCIDPCTRICGRNTECHIENHIFECSCLKNMIGDPLVGCKFECIFNAECSKDKICHENKCIDPCSKLCGKNAECDVTNHIPSCYCRNGQFGDPFKECKAECMNNTDCSDAKSCIDYKCDDPCPGSCGKNAICNVDNHLPVCNCPQDSTGDPAVECTLECETSSDCDEEKMCIDNKCINPCLGMCGKRATCSIVNKIPVCHCPPGLVGSPFIECIPALEKLIISSTTSTSIRAPAVIATTCITPPFPNNGTYLINDMEKPVGSEVDLFSVLTYSCNSGFEPNTDYPNSVCYEGKWVPEVECKRLCKNLVSYTLVLTCTYKGGRIDCDGPMRDGVIVTMACKAYHKKVRIEPLRPLTCKNGDWSRTLPRCEPECGEDKSKGQAYAINAAVAEPNTSPWHIGIHKKENGNFEYICGGTIVTNKVIFSAAHCFKSDSKKTIRYSKYKIAVGKFFSNWTNEEDDNNSFVQKKDVEKVHIPDTYNGQSLLLQSDLAIIIVKDIIEFSNFVHAACLDLSSLFATVQLSPGKSGRVVGWGVTKEGDANSVSKELRESIVPVVNRATCEAGVPKSFQRYTQIGDKFCAGDLKKGPTVCSGDSGGGFMISVSEKNTEKWYLSGIVSVGPIEESVGSTCKSNTYTVYTDVTKHSDYIENIIYDYIK